MNKNIKLLKPYFNFKKNISILIKRIATPKIIDIYFRDKQIIKIHLGCGGRIFKDWLNCDINLQSDCYVDLNKKLPFKDNSVDYIYSEHVLEHFDYQKGKEIMQECYRILKQGGIVRTAMPNLEFFTEGLNSEDFKYKEFSKWYKENFKELKNLPDGMNSMLNFIIGCCGHKYVYTEETFQNLLNEINFKEIKRVEAGKSEHKEFGYLENNMIGRHNNVINHLLQTMALEAKK